MSMQQFAQQIEHLLWTGAIEGEEIARLYSLLQTYGQGRISAEMLQEKIDRHDPKQLHIEPFLEDSLD